MHVPVSPDVLQWLVERSGKDPEDFRDKYPRWDARGSTAPPRRGSA